MSQKFSVVHAQVLKHHGQPDRSGDCRHRGQQLRLQRCSTCRGNVREKVFACSIHGECQPGNKLPGVKSCGGCADLKNDISNLKSHISTQKRVSPLRVSVAILCHNYGRFLDDCIDSVAAQTQTLHEVFVVNDSSEDETADVCRRRGIECLSVNHHDVHQTRKTAFDHATGDVLIFLDADDELTPDYVRAGCEHFDDSRVAIVYSDVEWFGNRKGRSHYPEAFDRDRLFRDNFIHAGSLVRRDALRLAGVFDVLDHKAPTHMDWTIWKRLARAGWTAAKQTAIYRYRQHGTNMLCASVVASYFDRADLATEPITLFVPLSGRAELWPRFAAQLEQLTWPRALLSLVLFDTSQSERFSRMVSSWISGHRFTPQTDEPFADVRHVCRSVGSAGVADAERRNNPTAVEHVRAAMARIYNWARGNITTNYALIMEDDIFPDTPNVIERLLCGFDEQTDSVAAPYASRYSADFVAWRLGTHGRKPIPLTQRGNGLEAIGGNGFGCTMLRNSFLRSQMFSDEPHAASGGTSHDFDIAFYLQAGQSGRLCKLDWSLHCDHVGTNSPKGTAP